MNNLTVTIDKHAVMPIWDREEDRPIGTGFAFLRPEWIVTAKHVVIADKLPRKKLGVVLADHQVIGGSVLVAHPEIDLAIIMLDSPSRCKTPLFPSYYRFAGTKGLISLAYSPTRTESDNRPVIFVNHVQQFDDERRSRKISDEETILFEAPYSEGGFSGSPILIQGGGVVGVVIEHFIRDSKKYARATAIQSLLVGLEYSKSWFVPQD